MTAIIFDLDGTLADIRHRRPCARQGAWPEFFALLEHDKVYPDRAAMFRALREASPHLLIICTGRPERYRAMTECWLAARDFEPDALLMRHDLDYRENAVVKSTQLDEVTLIYGEVIFAVDDRKSVVDMYEARNVPCLWVQDEDGGKSDRT